MDKQEVLLELVASKRAYIPRNGSGEVREFWVYEIVLQNGIRISVVPRERIGYQLLQLEVESLCK